MPPPPEPLQKEKPPQAYLRQLNEEGQEMAKKVSKKHSHACMI